MFRDQCHTEIICIQHHHYILRAKLGFEKRSVTGKVKLGRLCILFMYRSSYNSINKSFFQTLCSHLQRAYGIFAGDLRQFSRLYHYFFFPAIEYINLLRIDRIETFDAGKLKFKFRKQFTVKVNHFIRTEYDRSTELYHPVVR
ncbi:hypothetical protein D9M68_641200 [compost metagenome]